MKIKCLLAAAGMCLLSACSQVRAPFVPPLGVVSLVSAPLDVDVGETRVSTKKGTSSGFNVLGIVSVGDLSYETAAKNGGIKVIHSSDYEYLNVFFLFQKTTVNVYGE